jgi:hypothetical protein
MPGICERLPRGKMRWREWMGVEPTRAGSAPPHTGFEDRGAHRDSTTPVRIIHRLNIAVKPSGHHPTDQLTDRRLSCASLDLRP